MRLELNGGWKLLYRGLDADKIHEIDRADDFMEADALPCDVRQVLIREGVIKDPVVADHCFDSEWVEKKSWWFKRQFVLSREDLNARDVLLVLESLDLYADIFVNALPIGTHQNCHYPFEAEIKGYLREGINTLIVRLSAGAERITPEQCSFGEYACQDLTLVEKGRGEKSRVCLRKPQYVYGWDWAPRVATVGIMKSAYLLMRGDFAVTHVHPVTLEASGDAKMRFEVEFESHLPISTADAQVRLDVYLEGKKVLALEKEVLAVSGVNFVSFDATIAGARLWWPAGSGEQSLYTVCATLQSGGREYAHKPLRFGIRTVGLNQSKRADGSRRFAVQVNGKDIFCKGANWIPADSIYARVTPEKYQALIAEARECNFNMLRVWGGGLYERDEFYALCDQAGILLWHDFMFSCALYPDDREWFRAEAAKEIDYQTKRLRHHPCMALWCGNNENQWIFEKHLLNNAHAFPAPGGLIIYNQIAPSIIRNNCPEIPYWPSSPYGGQFPNDAAVGDAHHWHECTMHPDMAKRITPEEYDKVNASFVSEYGYIGPCSKESIQRYYGDNIPVRSDRIWELHNNTFEKDTVLAGIQKHYADVDALDTDAYLQYAGLVQGLMYAYSLESIRFSERGDGSLFWMYNDAWGEVGWSIIDYYLDRKPSFYFVKRAFAPVKLILRRSAVDGKVCVLGVNGTQHAFRGHVEYGYAGFDREVVSDRNEIEIPPFTKTIVLEFDMPKKDLLAGVIFAHVDGLPLALLRTGDFRAYKPYENGLRIERIEAVGNDYIVTVKSDSYGHAVHFGLRASVRLSDEYFDMLPGQSRDIVIHDAVGNIGRDAI